VLIKQRRMRCRCESNWMRESGLEAGRVLLRISNAFSRTEGEKEPCGESSRREGWGSTTKVKYNKIRKRGIAELKRSSRGRTESRGG
jgi:hypothetical protein